MSYVDPASAAAAATDTNQQQLEQVIDPAGDTEVTHVADTEQAGGAPDDGGEPRQPAANPVFTARADIAARFKAQREQRQEQIAAQQTEQLADDTAAATGDTGAVIEQQQAAPAKFTVKVRHETRELTQDELIAAAQKTLAGDDYLGEARKLLEDAKQVASSRPHQDGTVPATTEQQTAQTGDQPHQDDNRALAEKVQFGSPDEAAEVIAQLRKAGTIDPQAIAKAVYDTQRVTDVTKARRSYDKFVSDNEALVNDPIAHAAMEAAFYSGLKSDLRKLGYTDEQIPQANERLVEAHRFHRIQGQDVRDTSALLEASKQAVEKFRGTGNGDNPAPPARKDGEVRVNLDRTERRNGIPQQPARSAVPNQASTSPQPVQNARKAAMQKMAASGRRVIVT